ncbi:hypothetical protein INR49_000672 [Caranx melampygus]|nr:hypothetical protein INR49_000672 [Caranx melampygus]
METNLRDFSVSCGTVPRVHSNSSSHFTTAQAKKQSPLDLSIPERNNHPLSSTCTRPESDEDVNSPQAAGSAAHRVHLKSTGEVGGGRSIVTEGDGGETSEPDWDFGSRRATNRNKTEINCITHNMNEMSELGEQPRLLEMSYISLNHLQHHQHHQHHHHTNCLSPGRLEEQQEEEVVVVTIDETLQQRPPDTHSGT